MSRGFIYAVKCDGRVKIGWSERPYLRFSKISSDAPAPCEFVGVVPGTREDEKAVHNLLAAHRVHSEWFACEGAVLSFLDSLPTKGRPKGRRGAKRKAGASSTDLDRYLISEGVTGREFAARIGLSQAMISRLCTGRARPSLKIALAIRDATKGAVQPFSFLEVNPASAPIKGGVAA